MLESHHQRHQILAKKRSVPSKQIQAYEIDIQKLLQSPSVDDYEAVAEEVKAFWCEAF